MPITAPTTAPQERFAIQLRCRIDGRETTLLIAEAEAEAFRVRLDRVRVPIVGYENLRTALAKAGIETSVKTLQRMAGKRRLPCRRFGAKVTFYLPEVLERIGGIS